jgi:anti-sigma B factor antagonist
MIRSDERTATTMEPAQWPGLGGGLRAIDVSGLRVDHHIVGDGCAMVFVRGELDVAAADDLFEYVREVIERPSAVVLIDLAGLTFCDGSGLGCLVRIGNYAEAVGSRIMLAEPTPAVTRVLRIAELDRRFAIVPAPNDLRTAGDPPECPLEPVPPLGAAVVNQGPTAQ